MVIDTVADVVLGDVGEDIVSTSGVAVRPFWWSAECLEALGLAVGATGDSESAGEGSSTTAADVTSGDEGATVSEANDNGAAVAGNADGSHSAEGEEVSAQASALSAGWITLIVVLGVAVVGALAALIVLLSRGRRGADSPADTETGNAVPPGAAAGAAVPSPGDAVPSERAPFCSQCGHPLDGADRFCPGCGRQL